MAAPTNDNAAPAWARRWLVAAGVYNLAWGLWVILWPGAVFDLLGAEPMRYPAIWQCVGMIVGVYGVGYLIASRDPRRHWPIVLVGLLGKVFGPLGFAYAAARCEMPPAFGATLITNDLLWWAPFSMMLWDAARSRDALPEGPVPSLDEALQRTTDQHGNNLRELTEGKPVLLVLTRHAGCTFCREMLDELAGKRQAITERGYQIAIATMSDPDSNAALAERYGLEGCSWLSDPDRVLYRALELRRGRFLELFGPAVWLRGMAAGLRGHGVGALQGDGFQMAGTFVLHRGRVVREFRHAHAADRADYDALACELPR